MESSKNWERRVCRRFAWQRIAPHAPPENGANGINNGCSCTDGFLGSEWVATILYHEKIRSSVAVDSVGLHGFLRLPQAERIVFKSSDALLTLIQQETQAAISKRQSKRNTL